MAHILLGVTGSIAAFKACHLASDWTKAGHEVRVVMTRAAEQFITPLTFASITHRAARTTMFSEHPASEGDVAPADGQLDINHIADAAWADALVIAPASADAIARIAAGLADDTLTSTVLAYDRGPKILCPAMNSHMYANAATQRNIGICRELGWTVVEPEIGKLACGDTGRGRMEEPTVIEEAVAAALRRSADSSDSPLGGLKVLITAGPTQEALDPVRYLTNHSTGKMGYALARAARDMGADVTLVSGPTSLEAVHGVTMVDAVSADDMFHAVKQRFADADITIMAAAVGDFRPATVHPQKIKKQGRASLSLELVSNPDILAWAGEHKSGAKRQILCGFAMETEHLIDNASRKLNEKHCDMLVANNLRTPGAGFATDTNVVTLLTPTGAGNAGNAGNADVTEGPTGDAAPAAAHVEHLGIMGKSQLAGEILRRLNAMRES